MLFKKRIAIDADGVLLDFLTTWVSLGEFLLGRKLPERVRTYNLRTRYGLTNRELNYIFAQFAKKGLWENCHVIDGAIEYCLQLQQRGHSLFVVTNIRSEFYQARQRQLCSLGLDVPVYATGDERTKHKALEQIRPHAFIDDQVHNLLAAQQMKVRQLFWVENGTPDKYNIPPDILTHVKRVSHIAQIGL